MTSQQVLKVRNLWFSYDGKNHVLKGVSFHLSEGEAVAVMGTSGSGKTTLLKVVAGLIYPYQGEVWVRAGRGGVGYIPQQLGVVKNLSVLQNVLTGALGRCRRLNSLLGIFPREDVERAYGLLESLGIASLADRRASQLSGGEKQRVAVARALLQHPSILLADEFVSDLDVATAIDVMSMTYRLCKRENIAVLMTMHDPYLVNRFADRVIILNKGEVVAETEANSLNQERLETLLRQGASR